MRTVLLVALALTPSAARADDQAAFRARKYVEQAVEAAGWKDDGEALRLTWKDDGVMTAGGTKLAYTATWAVQTPDKYRFEMTTGEGERKQKLVFVVNGDKAWEAVDGKARAVTGDKLDYGRHEAYVLWVTGLTPLLRDDKFRLTYLGERRVGDEKAGFRRTNAVRVEREGHPAVVLDFDKADRYLVKSETRVKDEFQGWKEVADVAYYEGWKDIGGFQGFSKLRLVRDGKPLIESTLSDFKVVDKLDPKLFEKP